MKQFQPCFAIQCDGNGADLPEPVQSVGYQPVQLFSGAVQICGFYCDGQQFGLYDPVGALLKLLPKHIRIDSPEIVKLVTCGSQLDLVMKGVGMDTSGYQGQLQVHGVVVGIVEIPEPLADGFLPVFTDQSIVNIRKLNATGVLALGKLANPIRINLFKGEGILNCVRKAIPLVRFDSLLDFSFLLERGVISVYLVLQESVVTPF